MAGRSAFSREKPHTMPGTTSRTQKAEARYNVTTQFPQYDLHFAAASGNLGLVEFALSHGQPINSVLNGVLPLHAACAGGSEVVVKYLIDEGADVNAPRIPRRYSNEKHKSSGLAVGASGSTPLHFAAANGHMAVVRLLLARGAVPDRADKHNVTPEMLARENGWVECADVLAAWSGGRAGDLPPVQPGEASGSSCGLGGLERDRDACESNDMIQNLNGSRRLHMKRSIDNALHLFKAPLALHHQGSHGQLRDRDRTPPSPSSTAHLPSHFHHAHSGSSLTSTSHLQSIFNHTHSHSTSQLQNKTGSGSAVVLNTSEPNTGAPPSPRPLGEYTFYPTASPTSSSPLDGIPAHRRPSLPQIFDEPTSPFQRRVSGRRRRPRSAGSEDGGDNDNGVNGRQLSGGSTTNGHSGSNSNTISARKLSSKISLRNLFRRAGGEASGSEPGSGSASASTSFSTSSAPIYNHNFAPTAQTGKGSQSPTPPASPLSSSFAPSPAPAPSSWYRTRLGSESAMPAPRSPLVPSAVELHHQYSQEDLREDSDPEAQVVAPRLSGRPSILRGHNRSNSSQSSGGTPGAGTRTLRFEASSSSQNPIPAMPSAIRLRGSRSASSLRHGESFGYDEEDEEDEDYGTSINVPDSAPPGMMGYEDAELERSSEQGLAPSGAKAQVEGYKYGSTGRARGASFASTASSSPGPSPGNDNTTYEPSEFPFSIERPPLTPVSATSESSVTTRHSLADDAHMNLEVKIENGDAGDSRMRGASISSMETDASAASRNARSQSSSTSALTNITTPSPGVHPRTSSILDIHEPQHTESTRENAVYVQSSPSSSLEDLVSLDTEQSGKSMAPLDLRGISNLAEAEDLVQRAQKAILASASLPADGPESPDGSLAQQLAAYGEILALERRFARGEKQRELWSMRDDSEGEEAHAKQVPQSAKEARSMHKRRDLSRQRGATTGPSTATIRQKGVGKAPKHKRPHTAEGAPQTHWTTANNNTSTASPCASVPTPEITIEGPSHRSGNIQTHSRSTSSPLYIGKSAEKVPNIQIIETTATPVESPKTPERPTRPSPTRDLNSRYTIEDERPSFPARSRTPDPEASTDDFSFGVPLTRVSTAPLQDTSSAHGSFTGLRSNPESRRTGGAHKLAKMGFTPDASSAYSPSSSTGSSRSPSKARFGGIKSLVRGLKGKQ